jgi:alpha-L-rhamnosidase
MKRDNIFIKVLLVFCLFTLGFLAALLIVDSVNSLPVKSEFVIGPHFAGELRVHAPTIAETPFGLVVAWYSRSDELKEKIYISRLDRNSEHWTAPEMVGDYSGFKTLEKCYNPVLFQQKNGPLYLFYKTGENYESFKGMFRVSSDGGKTWADAQALPGDILGPAKNKPIELSDGTLLSPASVESPEGWDIFIERIRFAQPSDLLIRENWEKVGPLNDRSRRVIQPTLLRFADNEILLLTRNKIVGNFLSRQILEARSTDGGLSWTNLESTGLRNPNSGIDAVTLTDGRGVLVYNPSSIARTPLDVAVTNDRGAKWKTSLRLERGIGEYSYPSVIQTSSGMIHIVYTWKKRNIRHVVVDPRTLD